MQTIQAPPRLQSPLPLQQQKQHFAGQQSANANVLFQQPQQQQTLYPYKLPHPQNITMYPQNQSHIPPSPAQIHQHHQQQQQYQQQFFPASTNLQPTHHKQSTLPQQQQPQQQQPQQQQQPCQQQLQQSVLPQLVLQLNQTSPKRIASPSPLCEQSMMNQTAQFVQQQQQPVPASQSQQVTPSQHPTCINGSLSFSPPILSLHPQQSAGPSYGNPALQQPAQPTQPQTNQSLYPQLQHYQQLNQQLQHENQHLKQLNEQSQHQYQQAQLRIQQLEQSLTYLQSISQHYPPPNNYLQHDPHYVDQQHTHHHHTYQQQTQPTTQQPPTPPPTIGAKKSKKATERAPMPKPSSANPLPPLISSVHQSPQPPQHSTTAPTPYNQVYAAQSAAQAAASTAAAVAKTQRTIGRRSERLAADKPRPSGTETGLTVYTPPKRYIPPSSIVGPYATYTVNTTRRGGRSTNTNPVEMVQLDNDSTDIAADPAATNNGSGDIIENQSLYPNYNPQDNDNIPNVNKRPRSDDDDTYDARSLAIVEANENIASADAN